MTSLETRKIHLNINWHILKFFGSRSGQNGSVSGPRNWQNVSVSGPRNWHYGREILYRVCIVLLYTTSESLKSNISYINAINNYITVIVHYKLLSHHKDKPSPTCRFCDFFLPILIFHNKLKKNCVYKVCVYSVSKGDINL